MSIKIYTYSNPYYLNQEDFWNKIDDAPYFCVTQTLVNGLSSRFPNDFPKGRISTLQNLINYLYEDWLDTGKIIKQQTDLDSIITQDLFDELSSFAFNRDEIIKSIRIMFELGMEYQNINRDLLSKEQCIVYDIYKRIHDTNRINDFRIDEIINDQEIIEATTNALLFNVEDDYLSKAKKVADQLDYSKIVIHGVHQFTPLMLKMIEKLSETRDVYLIFPYQDHLKNIYQTWLDIYSTFDEPINFSKNNRLPSLTTNTNVLGDSLGKVLNGQLRQAITNPNIEIVEFDNTTEFANYASTQFEKANSLKEQSKNILDRSTLAFMKEQFYSADFSVNDLLKVYYPEQFGERHFLNYPLGHFFLAIANMWDEENQCLQINDLDDVKECLQSHFFTEDHYGELCKIFTKAEAMFSSPLPTTIKDMLKRLKRIEKRIKNDNDVIDQIEYCNLSIEQLQKLSKALNELGEISEKFFQEFAATPQNFKLFYKNVQSYLVTKLEDDHTLDNNFRDIIERVVSRLEEVKNINASASMSCLINTMNLYLEQMPKKNASVHWIVRNFEQIDGDILRNNDKKIMHFACLSDEDINATQRRDFSWPLDEDFFERAQSPIDWKYQCYVKSSKEYKNFRRYALIYGLQFCRSKVKLSYIKRNGNHERSLYYPLKLLKVHVRNYFEFISAKNEMEQSNLNFMTNQSTNYTLIDYDRYHLCPFKFLQETLVEGQTIYKDPFLLTKFIETILKDKVKNDESYQAIVRSNDEDMLDERLEKDYKKLSKYFPFLSENNRIDILFSVRNSVTGYGQFDSKVERTFLRTSLYDEENTNILKNKFPKLTQEEVNEKMNDYMLSNVTYNANVNKWCEFCANKLLCGSYYKLKK